MGYSPYPKMFGKIANVVVYELNGKLIVRSRPRKYEQTKATKQKAKEFALITRLSAQIRNSVSPIVPEHRSKPVMCRLNATLIQWFKRNKPTDNEDRIDCLHNFQFYEKSELVGPGSYKWKINWHKSSVSIQLPMPHLFNPPTKAQSVKITVIAMSGKIAGTAEITNHALLDRIIDRSLFKETPTSFEIPFKGVKDPFGLIVLGFQFQLPNRKTKNTVRVIQVRTNEK